METAQSLLHYSPAVEQPAADEAETFAELSRVMGHITRTMADRYRHPRSFSRRSSRWTRS